MGRVERSSGASSARVGAGSPSRACSATWDGLALAATSAWAQTPPPNRPPNRTTARTTSRCPGWTSAGSATSTRSRSRASTSCPTRSRTPRSPSPSPGAGARGARAVHPPRRAAHRARHQPGRGRGRRAPGRQPHAARLPGRQRHLSSTACATWASTPATPSTSSRSRCSRGPPSVLFGRGSTGGVINQVSKSPKLTPFYEVSGTVGSGPQGRATVDINQPFGDSAALRLNLMGFKGETPGRDQVTSERWGAAPVVRHRPERADPADRQLLLPWATTTCPTTASPTSGAARPRSARELLRSAQARLRARRRPHRHDPARARLQREHPAPQHAAAGPDPARLAHLGPGHRRHAGAHDTSAVRSTCPAPASSGVRKTRA